MNPRYRIQLAAVIGAAAITTCVALVPASAHAASTVECVGFTASVPADCTATHPASSLQATLASVSDSDVDTVRIAPGTYTGAFAFGGAAGDHVIGAGADQTILVDTAADSGATLTVNGADAAHAPSVSNLAVTRSNGTAANSAAVATYANLDHVSITGIETGATLGQSLIAFGVTADHSRIAISGSNTRAVLATGDFELRDSVLVPLTPTAIYGIQVSTATGTTAVRRSTIGDTTGTNSFLRSMFADSGTMVLEDSLVDLGSRAGGGAVDGSNSNSGNKAINVVVRRSTIVGTGAGQHGVYGASDNPGEVLTVVVDDSVVKLAAPNLGIECHRGASGVVAGFSVDRTAFDDPNLETGLPCGLDGDNDVFTKTITPAQLFVDPASHDFRPLPGGPLIDAGTPALSVTTTDLAGGQRVLDGDGDGTARVDLGAFEYARPVVLADPPVDPAVAAQAAGGTTAGVTTAGGAQHGAGSIAGRRDTTAPSLAVAAPLHALAFWRTKRGAFAAARASEPRALRVTLGEAATVRVTLARKVGAKYVAVRGTQTLTLAAGARRIGWTGTWQGTPVAVGTYRVTLVATDAAGNASAARSTTVRLVTPPHAH